MARQKEVRITAPDMQVAEFLIEGNAPYVQHRFGAKTTAQMHDTQEKGSTTKKGKAREKKDFQACYIAATHRLPDGRHGIPASGFRAALISACRLVGFAMTRAKLSLFVLADGYDEEDRTPLFVFTKGKPHYFEAAVRNADLSVDLRARPMWDAGWQALLRVRFDAGQFTLDDVAALVMRVGEQVGLGEGRPDSKKSAGCGWGTFTIISEEQKAEVAA